jgi:hypothetical protein
MARPSYWPWRTEVYLTRAMRDALKAAALREGPRPSQVVRRAVIREIERLNTPVAERK